MPVICVFCKKIVARSREKSLVCGTCRAICHESCVPCAGTAISADSLAGCPTCALPSSSPATTTPPADPSSAQKRKERDTPTPPATLPPAVRQPRPGAAPSAIGAVAASAGSSPATACSRAVDTPLAMSGDDAMPSWFAEWQEKCFTPALSGIASQFNALKASVELVSGCASSIRDEINSTRAEFVELKNDVRSIVETVEGVRGAVGENASRISAVDAATRDVARRSAVLEGKIAKMELAVAEGLPSSSASSVPPQEDLCEALVSGFPRTPSLPDPVAEMGALLESIQLGHLQKLVLSVRTWEPRPPAGPSAGSSASRAASPPRESASRSLVVQFASANTRDYLVANAHRLRGVTPSSVFPGARGSHFAVRPVWPREVYHLYKAAVRGARELGYQRPFVRRGVVCLRAARGSPLLMVRTAGELAELPRAQPAQPGRATATQREDMQE